MAVRLVRIFFENMLIPNLFIIPPVDKNIRERINI